MMCFTVRQLYVNVDSPITVFIIISFKYSVVFGLAFTISVEFKNLDNTGRPVKT